ncbi:Ras family protein, putative, partial [Ichthyophthirius multifiliis]
MQRTNYGEYDYLFKLLLIGNSGVGKSCMLMRFSENQFTNNFYNTIGVDFKIKTIQLNGKNIKLQIWDTAGQDRFKTITCSYYRGAHGIAVVFDITDKQSFENVKGWMVEIEKYAQENVCRILVGNKTDMNENRQVQYQEGQELAQMYNLNYIEVSAKSGENVDQVFTQMAKQIMEKQGDSLLKKQSSREFRIDQNKNLNYNKNNQQNDQNL